MFSTVVLWHPHQRRHPLLPHDLLDLCFACLRFFTQKPFFMFPLIKPTHQNHFANNERNCEDEIINIANNKPSETQSVVEFIDLTPQFLVIYFMACIPPIVIRLRFTTFMIVFHLKTLPWPRVANANIEFGPICKECVNCDNNSSIKELQHC